MRRTIMLSVAFGLCIALGGCNGCGVKKLADKASISKDLEKRGTTDLLKSVADEEYTPPADGHLTDAQIQMYLKVREHEKQIAEVAKEEMKGHAEQAKEDGEHSIGAIMEGFKAIGSAADFATADIRAAKDLGYNTKEYLWVKGQILAASTSALVEKIGNSASAGMDKAYEQAKKAYAEAKDEQTKKMYENIVKGYEKSRQEMRQNAQQDPAIAYNRRLLSKYENELNAYAQEISKYEDKEGAVQKSVEDLEKQSKGQ
jgi:hypothetical protein